MVTRPTTFCDIMLARENKTVLATSHRSITIPAVASQSGKSERLRFDVSPEGEKILDAMMARMNKALLGAPKELFDLRDRLEAKAEDLGPLRRKSSTDDSDASDGGEG